MAEETQVIACHSVNAWNEHFSRGKDPCKLVVVDFTATWCGPCRFIAPVFAALAKKHPEALFLKVDVDELKTVANEWGVEAMPTFLLIVDGIVVDKVVGAAKDELEQKIEIHAATIAAKNKTAAEAAAV